MNISSLPQLNTLGAEISCRAKQYAESKATEDMFCKQAFSATTVWLLIKLYQDLSLRGRKPVAIHLV